MRVRVLNLQADSFLYRSRGGLLNSRKLKYNSLGVTICYDRRMLQVIENSAARPRTQEEADSPSAMIG